MRKKPRMMVRGAARRYGGGVPVNATREGASASARGGEENYDE